MEKKPKVNKALLGLMCSGVSQRRAAEILNIHPITVARKITRIARYSHEKSWEDSLIQKKAKNWIFDEMETFEHSKCKPVSIALAVEEKTRKILCIKVSQMPAKGKLAKISKKKYGQRKDLRPKMLQSFFKELYGLCEQKSQIKSDMNPRYKNFVSNFFPRADYEQFKGRRACVVGQGELKRGGWDPLFFLNHSCAMIRDNIKRLSRRTWCTTKKIGKLAELLSIYKYYHNFVRLA